MQNLSKVLVVVVLLFLLSAFMYRVVLLRNHTAPPSEHSCLSSTEQHFPRRLLGFSSYSDEMNLQLQSLVQRKASADDPELVAFARRVIDFPSNSNMIKMSRALVITPQAKEIDVILQKQKKGFFVEAGALDGERSSNSIFFEKEREWTGLLVEPDPYFYTQLIGKNRNSWSINACLSVHPYVMESDFQESSGGHGKLLKDKTSSSKKVPCFPLETMLLAINVSTVDFFSLDVEGFELEVLMTIPMDRINIRSLAVEYLHGNEQKCTDFMASKRYKMVRKLHEYRPEISLYVDDLIFAYQKLIGQND